jgi:3',5'-cyclic AMP phosphodiesterase CpdA
VQQDDELAAGTIRVPGGDDSALRVIIYGDSEAEPESAGKHAPWGSADDSEDMRRYPVDQDRAYRENLKVMVARRPDMVAIAGDLVQSGGEQRDWDEFWKLNAALAASVPIYAAPGNHDYFGGPGPLGKYSNPAARRAINKYQAYFAPATDGSNATYFAIRRGPASFIFLDGNDGLPATSANDTNWYMNPDETDSVAPDWTPGSTQYQWLEQTLATAAASSEFIFVVMHASAWSSGVHALPPGFEAGEDPLSGAPMRALGGLFMRYGVNAVFSGHDELYEHSLVQAEASAIAGTGHELHYFVIGTGGDGLRGSMAAASNPHQVFLASRDAAEVADATGVLEDGGLHYGHIELRLDRTAAGEWQATIEPAYVFPRMSATGELLGFERRVYDDGAVIAGRRLDTGATDSGVRR